MEHVRTFEMRAAEILKQHSPFKDIEEFTEWFLDRRHVFDLMDEAEWLDSEFRHRGYREVPFSAVTREFHYILDVDNGRAEMVLKVTK